VNEFIKSIKRVSLEAIDEKKPVNVCFGEVTNASPLIIKVEQKLTVSEKMLIIPRFLSDFETDASVSGENFTLKLQNALKKGDKVLLLRMQGGQKFVILDKLKEDK